MVCINKASILVHTSSNKPEHQEEWRHLGVPPGRSCLYSILFCVSSIEFYIIHSSHPCLQSDMMKAMATL